MTAVAIIIGCFMITCGLDGISKAIKEKSE